MPEENQPQKSKIAEREEHMLEFWQQNATLKKTLEKKSTKGDFVFYDGPPFATGLPHYGHILTGTIKDVIPRFKTMQGFRVPRRWGWDCHGLPVENEVEKELGFKTKKDIEHYSIEKFNVRAKELVMRYADDWRRIIPRMGRWVDMVNDYRTMDSSYTETVWWIFKTLYEKGLIYEGFKSMHLCPRCETTLSNFEVSQGYQEVNDLSVYVKFKVLNLPWEVGTSGDVFAVAWTTTPWTLPGNVALAVHPERDYAFVEITASNAPEFKAGDTYIVGADERILKRVFSAEGGGESVTFDPVSKVGSFSWRGAAVSFAARKGVRGKELIGQRYQPLFDYYKPQINADVEIADKRGLNISVNPRSHQRESASWERGWRIYAGDFVTEEDGTGIVHIAPAFGEDDYELARKEKLPFIQHVATDGTFKKEVADPVPPGGHGVSFAGRQAKPAGNPRETDEKIAALLASRGSLLKKEDITHEYPHCWRCETPLLNYAAPSWFVRVTALREKLVAENKKVKWIPKEVGEYRFGNWLAEARDWAISRSRYWGAPIPVWRCERCGTVKVVGSLNDVRTGSKELITKLILLRHGESEKNRQHVFDDSPEAFGLMREGRREAKAAARRIEAMGGVDAVFVSPVRRAKETASIIGAYLGKTVSVDERLREVDSGEWDGRREDDPAISESRAAYNALPADAYFTAPRGHSGESWQDVERRMSDALESILAKHAGETVLLVSHEGPLVYLLKAVDNLTLRETDKFFRKDLLEGYAQPIVVYVNTKTRKEFDIHRPFIDAVLLHCDECARKTGSGAALMRRVPEVFDCWFESGAMPYGQAHYPFDSAGSAQGKPFDPIGGWFRKSRGFPAHFIAEGLDQTRGWFYSLLVLGVGLFEKSPYETVVVNGIILAENGEKMSKRLKNYPDPLELVEKYGADALRYYLLSSPVVRGEELRFSEQGVSEVMKKVFNRLDNVLSFYLLYAPSLEAKSYKLKARHVLDRWIVARLNQLIASVTGALEQYELDRATRPIGEFVDDLSTWYLRRSRERIKSDVVEEKESALSTLRYVLYELAKVMAPFAPFFAEYVYQQVNGQWSMVNGAATSVHLEEWPKTHATRNTQHATLLEEMNEVRRTVSLALEARMRANIKVRQPLALLKIRNPKLEIRNKSELLNLIKEEINVKEIMFDDNLVGDMELDTVITPELKDEGQFRELLRTVQDMRKKQGFKPGEFATLTVGAEGASRRFLEQRQQGLARIAFLKDIVIAEEQAGLPAASGTAQAGTEFRAEQITLFLTLTPASAPVL